MKNHRNDHQKGFKKGIKHRQLNILAPVASAVTWLRAQGPCAQGPYGFAHPIREGT